MSPTRPSPARKQRKCCNTLLEDQEDIYFVNPFETSSNLTLSTLSIKISCLSCCWPVYKPELWCWKYFYDVGNIFFIQIKRNNCDWCVQWWRVQQRRWEDGPGPVYYSSVPVVLRGPRPQHPHIYTISTEYLHSIYTISTQYLHSIYTISTQYLHNIYTVSTYTISTLWLCESTSIVKDAMALKVF